MMRWPAILVFLLCAAHAQARTLYVSTTGSHDTNAPAFSTWATAATNIQAAIDAADEGDTVRVAPGTYTAQVTINKNSLTVQGGNGTLWDADRTIIDRQGAASSVGVTFSGATNSVLRGFTVVGARPTYGGGAVYINQTSTGCVIESCVVRGNQSAENYTSGIRSIGSSSEARNCIVVGNHAMYGGVSAAPYLGSDGFFTIQNCIVEANANYQAYLQGAGRITAINCVLGNAYSTTHAGGNVTNNTTNSVCRVLNIAPASEGVGTNLQWAGVAAYIPRIGSLAQGAGVGYAGIDTAKRGDGGPALVPAGAEFLGRDATTNLNHGSPIGGVTASTNSPFAGERSAAFDGTSGYVDLGDVDAFGLTGAMTLEYWAKGDSLGYYRTVNKISGPNLRAFGSILYFGTNYFTLASDANTVANYIPTNFMPAGVWFHFAAVYSPSSYVRCFINGEQVLESTSSIPAAQYNANGLPLFLGAFIQSGTTKEAHLDGNLSDVRIWSVARTPEEIAANYTNTLTGTEAGLVGYWRLDARDTPISAGPFNLRNPLNHPTYMEAF